MNHINVIDKIIDNTISLNEILKISICYNNKTNLDIKEFIKQYQNYQNKPHKILELLNGLDMINYKFDDELFSDHLINGLHDEITLWYINKFPANNEKNNKFLLDATLSIEAYRGFGFPLKTLLLNGYKPNFKKIDWFFFKGNYDGGQIMSYECYYLFLEFGYEFANPLMFYCLFMSISYNIYPTLPPRFKNSSIKIDLEKLMNFNEVKKWFEKNPIEINETHLQNFLDLEYYNSRDEIIEELVNEMGFIKNKFIKWPNIIINFNNYNCDKMDRTQTKICKYPLIGYNDNFEQNDFLL